MRSDAHSLMRALANLLFSFSARNLLIVPRPGGWSLRKRPAHILIRSSGIVFVYSGNARFRKEGQLPDGVHVYPHIESVKRGQITELFPGSPPPSNPYPFLPGAASLILSASLFLLLRDGRPQSVNILSESVAVHAYGPPGRLPREAPPRISAGGALWTGDLRDETKTAALLPPPDPMSAPFVRNPIGCFEASPPRSTYSALISLSFLSLSMSFSSSLTSSSR